ncbi:class I SAM-dependent methyltransferase, partial [Lachnospiraceae bacterium OttesenSCG-928-J05]|nr:class I SAM-dependent methyltransferase [Lachnospiraceae bacterium OttesenSCG-928-J05]
ESHLGLQRQGPGSDEMTLKALSFIDNLDESSKVADIGCGTGTQTITLAKNTPGDFIGVDMVQDFVDIFNSNIKMAELTDRVKGMVGDALSLPFTKDSFDLIWSEGMIDSLGFEKTLNFWNAFLKKGGYVAVTSPSWLTRNRPAEIAKFWTDAGSGLYAIEDNIASMQKVGYSFVSAFTLPENCWLEGYFTPRVNAEKMLLEKYSGNQVVEEYVKSMRYEVDLYRKNKADYGYVFYIGKKM